MPSTVLSTMLPTKPSVTTTSTRSANSSVALDVADEIQIELPAKFGGFARQFGALGFLGAVAQDADAGPVVLEHLARIDAAHDRELDEVNGLAFVVGADVEQRRTRPWPEGMTAAMRRAFNRSSRRSRKSRSPPAPPVLPGEMTASALPSRTSSTARTIEQSFFLRTASSGLSSMVMTSEAWTNPDASVMAAGAFRGRLRSRSAARPGCSSVMCGYGLQRELDPINDDPGAVVATHDIHSDAHKWKERSETSSPSALLQLTLPP